MNSAGYMRNINYAAVLLRESFTSYEAVKEHLALRLMGIKGNEEFLDKVPHMRREDMAVTALCFFPDKSSVPVTRCDVRRWETDVKTLFSDALLGSMKLLPPVFRSMGEMIGVSGTDGSEDMYVLTNERTLFGAAAVLYPNLLDAVLERVGNSFYLLPSSIHEMIVLPDTGEDPMELKKIVEEVNRTEVLPEEVLTDSVYYFGEGDATFYRIC